MNNNLFNLLFGTNPKSSAQRQMYVWDGRNGPLAEKDYQTLPTLNDEDVKAPLFSDYLQPSADIAGKYVLFKDLNTVGITYELIPLSVEGRSEKTIGDLFRRATKIFNGALPDGSETGNWIFQIFLEDERSLEPLITKLIDYIPASRLKGEYTQWWLDNLEVHLKQVGQKKGLFFDKTVSNSPWRGRMRRVRCCLWYQRSDLDTNDIDIDIDQVSNSIINAVAQCGATLIPCKPVELYAWLSRWFVPALEEGGSVEQYLRSRPWYSTNLRLVGRETGDLGAATLHSTPPRSDADGNWYFRDQPTRFITLEEIADTIPIGILTGEQAVGEHRRVLWDSMPPGSIFSMSIISQNQESITEHVQKIKLNSVGSAPSVLAKRAVADEVIANMASGKKVYRLFAGIFVRGTDIRDLNMKCSESISLFNSYGLKFVSPQEDPIAQDTFLRALPFGFDPTHDKKSYISRSRLWYTNEITKLAPIFGRSTGTGHPGLIFFNRGADPLTFDILSKEDRKKNSHALILGPTGSGKTSLIIYILLQLIAVHKPRIFLVSALPTFKLFTDHLKKLGLTVNHIRVGEDKNLSLPPFADASLLGENEQARDVLSELELQTVLMITGGDPKEEEALRRADRTLIRRAIERAVKLCRQENRQVLTEDIVASLREITTDDDVDDKSKSSLMEKARAMEFYCSGLGGQLFNRKGSLWSNADVTVFELGPLATESAKDYLVVAVTSLLSRINALAQKEQNSSRQMITIIDEAHILLKNPLITPYLNNIAAMWRTFGAWLWIATQTLKQFPKEAQELLAQPEWWLLMTMDQEEVNEIARFKNLSEEEKNMLLATRKEVGKYTEGVILSAGLSTLFRSVVPSIALALSQTEKHEKARRAEIMQEHNCCELEAAYRIADEITQARENKEDST